jgi:hypothetical protein
MVKKTLGTKQDYVQVTSCGFFDDPGVGSGSLAQTSTLITDKFALLTDVDLPGPCIVWPAKNDLSQEERDQQ